MGADRTRRLISAPGPNHHGRLVPLWLHNTMGHGLPFIQGVPRMAVKPTPKKASKPTAKKADGPLVVPRSVLEGFSFWIEGASPLVVHAWSLKAKNSMLKSQGGDTLSPDGKVARNPQQDFL